MEKSDITYVLWTGGWDSTYRIVELSREDITVQPIYVEDPGRKSTMYELRAMETILKILNKKQETIAEIKPVKRIHLSDIPENEEISKAYLFLKNETDMGSQHDWLARLALSYPMIELCIEKALGTHTPIKTAIEKWGGVVYKNHGYIIDRACSSRELNLVLGNIKLPIFDKTEMEMLDNIKKWGYEDVMSQIWFCHAPIHGKPCGLCNPCTTKMNSKMEFLLPKKAQKRNIHMQKIEAVLGKRVAYVYKIISRKLAH